VGLHFKRQEFTQLGTEMHRPIPLDCGIAFALYSFLERRSVRKEAAMRANQGFNLEHYLMLKLLGQASRLRDRSLLRL
jgi:hypothetical protein